MEPSQEIQERAKALRDAITSYRKAFHGGEEISITDEALDSLKHELKLLEEAYPSLITPDSPTQIVVGTLTPGLKKVTHAVSQWSLEDAFTEDEVHRFDERVRKVLAKELSCEVSPRYSAELKIDGLHIVLTYVHGRLVTAATRGDGRVGEDVTHTVRTITGIPEMLTRPLDIVVEGEVYMTRSGLETLNEKRRARGEQEFANPRNVASGSLRQLDASVAQERPLRISLYDIDVLSESLPQTQSGELALLKELGFPVNEHALRDASIDDIFEFWQTWQGKKRESVDYQIDGVVIKVEERSYQEMLGYTGKGPRFSIALKFPAEQVHTVIEDITLQVGRTGVLTPVAKLRPVAVAGTVVARATLHNEDFIKEKDIRIGDTVILQKAGDIIPEIVSVLKEFRPAKTTVWNFPKFSPLCGGDGGTERVPGQSAYRCRVGGSVHEQVRKIAHFAGKHALDIPGLGGKTVELLMEHKLVSDFDDLFTLTRDELLELPGFKEKSADNLLRALEQRRHVSLDRLLVGLSILHVGEEMARLLARATGGLDELKHASLETLIAIPQVGEVVARSVYDWFRTPAHKELLKRLETYLTVTTSEDVSGGPLQGRKVVVTGTLPTLSRSEAEERIRTAGGSVQSSVSSKTSFVVAGTEAGSKLSEAERLGIPVIDEEEFLLRLSM
ncbi:MAG: NAD-dependent DNA ligase LigA [Candidatus Pacebacteria bacterium]|nr:NAD-dependent DNA ligase LigA [Candidatus Paceibacterota bacterium]